MIEPLRRTSDGIPIWGDDAFAKMRVAGKMAASTLDFIVPHVVEGVNTEELDDLMHSYINRNGAVPAPLNYKGFPKATCISVNNVICHGIPSPDKKLKKGDILNIDVTTIVDDFHGDTSRMYIVGETNIKAQRLIDVTYKCLMESINAVKPGLQLGDIGHIIQTRAEAERFSVVRDFCGHGLGRTFHAPPSVVHFYDKRDDNVILEPGMFFTIEPMINRKGYEVLMKEDGWTAGTRGANNPSAQFEHSLAVTDDGFEIFTLSPKGHTKPPYA